MAAARPVVQVRSVSNGNEVVTTVPLPAVFGAPIRTDIVQFVHTNVNKNSRQAYAVSEVAGEQTSALSWGTGRAVARIPRVKGGGTGRSGQAAFGNMCRGGRMYNPNVTWRKWHVKVNLNQRRFATAAAIAATAVAPLVQARGHAISNVAEVPLVIDNSVESVKKTKEAEAILKAIGAFDDVLRVKDSRSKRSGKGKMRGRVFKQAKGPLVIYNSNEGIVKAFRNIRGVELCQVSRLNLLQLAPGGHVGRFVVWTQAAFEQLDALYGTDTKYAKLKKNYSLPKAIINNADIDRIINSDEVQAALNPIKTKQSKKSVLKKNAQNNWGVMLKLNPYAGVAKRAELLKEKQAIAKKAATKAARASGAKATYTAKQQKAKGLKAAAGKAFIKNVQA